MSQVPQNLLYFLLPIPMVFQLNKWLVIIAGVPKLHAKSVDPVFCGSGNGKI